MNSRTLRDADWGEIVRQDAALRLGLPLADRSPQAASLAFSDGEVAADRLMTREQVLVMLWPEGRRPAREAVDRLDREGTRVRGFAEPIRLRSILTPGGKAWLESDVQSYWQQLQQAHEAVKSGRKTIDRRTIAPRERERRGAKAGRVMAEAARVGEGVGEGLGLGVGLGGGGSESRHTDGRPYPPVIGNRAIGNLKLVKGEVGGRLDVLG